MNKNTNSRKRQQENDRGFVRDRVLPRGVLPLFSLCYIVEYHTIICCSYYIILSSRGVLPLRVGRRPRGHGVAELQDGDPPQRGESHRI